ncbi:MAG: GNAT family N-acetyltransferase [Thermodesulfobacteriota bacterium]
MSPETRIPLLDKTGCVLELGECGHEHEAELKEMYDGFGQLALAQGLPPIGKENRHRWVQALLECADNFVVWDGPKIVGHVALIVDHARRDGEYIIFVADNYRQRGLGSGLTRAAIERARELELTAVWLTVESFNFRAIKLYRKAGFEFADKGGQERSMVLRL